jgi:hypothetical protein
LHAGQVARIAGLLDFANACLEAFALGVRGLLGGAGLPLFLAGFPSGPVFSLQIVDAG